MNNNKFEQTMELINQTSIQTLAMKRKIQRSTCCNCGKNLESHYAGMDIKKMIQILERYQNAVCTGCYKIFKRNDSIRPFKPIENGTEYLNQEPIFG